MAQYPKVAIVGVGLIGGSIGLAVRKHGLAEQVIGIGRRESSLQTALDVGAIHFGTTDLAEGVSEADFVVVCAPVEAIPDLVAQVAAACPKRTIITDAGSTKVKLLAEIAAQKFGAASGGPFFVGSHPMAGDHRTGAAHGRADLFEGRTVVVTPTDKTDSASTDSASTDPASQAAVGQFWESLGANVLCMSPEAHDEAVALTSHLPHLVAYALASTAPTSAGPLAAGSWHDTTRVAGAEPELWQQIFFSNDTQVLAAVDRFTTELAALRQAIATGNEAQLVELLQQAKRTRDALGS